MLSLSRGKVVRVDVVLPTFVAFFSRLSDSPVVLVVVNFYFFLPIDALFLTTHTCEKKEKVGLWQTRPTKVDLAG